MSKMLQKSGKYNLENFLSKHDSSTQFGLNVIFVCFSLPELEKDMNYLRSSINLQEIDQQESTNNGLNTFEIKYKIESLEKLFIEMRKRVKK